MARNRVQKQETQFRLRPREREATGLGAAADYQSESTEQQHQIVKSSYDGEGSEQVGDQTEEGRGLVAQGRHGVLYGEREGGEGQTGVREHRQEGREADGTARRGATERLEGPGQCLSSASASACTATAAGNARRARLWKIDYRRVLNVAFYDESCGNLLRRIKRPSAKVCSLDRKNMSFPSEALYFLYIIHLMKTCRKETLLILISNNVKC